MLLTRFLRPEGSEKREEEFFKGYSVPQNKELMRRCTRAVRLFARSQDWSGAVAVAVKGAHLSPAEIANELGVMRSTVSRWMDGTMLPHPKAQAEFLQKLEQAIDKQAS